MGSLRKVALPKTQLRIKKPRETDFEDDYCKQWWMKALELATDCIELQSQTDNEVELEGHAVDFSRVFSTVDFSKPYWGIAHEYRNLEKFTEQDWCRLLDVFQGLENGESSLSYLGNKKEEIQYSMWKYNSAVQLQESIGNQAGVNRVRRLNNSGEHLEGRYTFFWLNTPGRVDSKKTGHLNLQVYWSDNMEGFAKSYFGTLLEHLSIELE